MLADIADEALLSRLVRQRAEETVGIADRDHGDARGRFSVWVAP